MDIRQVAKIIGPVVLSKTDIGNRLVTLANGELPETYRLSADLTGDEALNRLDKLPEEYQYIFNEVNVIVENEIEPFKKQIRKIKREEGISTTGQKNYLVIGSAVIFLMIAMAMVFSYILATVNGTSQADATLLLKILDIVTEVLKQSGGV